MNNPYYDDDDGYDDDYYDHDNNQDQFKWYFKFDVDKTKSLSEWVTNQINEFLKEGNKWTVDNSTGLPIIQFPVNGWNPSTGNDIKFQYLGSNYQGQKIVKTKHSVSDYINKEYRHHIQAHAKHFVSQPHYYNGMFDILN